MAWVMLVFFSAVLGIALWHSGGEVDFLVAYTAALIAATVVLHLRQRKAKASRWEVREPTAGELHWVDVALPVAIFLAFPTIPLAAFHRSSTTPSLALVGALMLALVAWWAHRHGQHVSAIQVWCLGAGHRFHARGYWKLRRKYKGLSLPRWNGHAAPIVEGRHRGLPFVAFEYHRPPHKNRHHEDPAGTVVALLPGQKLEPLEIHRRYPENGPPKGEVKLELTAFNEAFRVEVDARAWAFDVLDQETMEHLLAAPHFDRVLVGEDAIIVHHRAPLEGQGIEAALDLAHGLFSRIRRLD